MSPIIVHQSDITSMNRCGEQHRRQINGQDGKQLSVTAYGSVIHHALHTLERTRDLDVAINTFEHYWHPVNIEAICRPVDEWIMRQSYGQLNARGVELLKRYWDLKQYDDLEDVLALEMPFVVELPNGHLFGGTIDRLALRKIRGRLYLCIDDWKSGKKKTYLQHNVQHIGYAWATTRPEFWVGSAEHHTEGFGPVQGAQLYDQLANVPRRGYWIDVSDTTPKWNDCATKTERDYRRFLLAADQYIRMREAQIFPLAVTGDVCQFCPFRDDCPEEI